MHFTLFISMKYPPPGNFLLSPSLFSIKSFCSTRAFVGKLNLLLMVILPHISRADQPLTKFDQIEADCPLLVVHFNDGNFSVLVTGSPRIHQPPHPILKHRFECSILCTDEHTSQRAGFDSKDDYQWMAALLNGRCWAESDSLNASGSRASPFHFRAMPWFWGVRQDGEEQLETIRRRLLTVIGVVEVALRVILLRDVLNSPFSIHRSQFTVLSSLLNCHLRPICLPQFPTVTLWSHPL